MKPVKANGENCVVEYVNVDGSKTMRTYGAYNSTIAVVPVLITRTGVDFHIEYAINFEKPVFDVKYGKKEIFITGCTLFNMESKRLGKIHVSGNVKERIEYNPVDSIDNKNVNCSVCYKILTIPFEFSLRVEYFTMPANINFAKKKLIPVEVKENKLINKYIAEKGMQGRLYMELQSAKINTLCLDKEIIRVKENGTKDQIFDNCTCQMQVSLVLMLLQNQMVNLPFRL